MKKQIASLLGCAAVTAAVVVAATPAAAAPPAPGTCWNLTQDQWRLPNMPVTTAVDCATSHTAETLGSVPLSASMATASVIELRAWAYQQCYAVARDYVDAADRAALPASAQLATFIPTTEQQAAGEMWVHCVGINTNAKRQVAARVGTVAEQGTKPNLCVNWKNWDFAKCSKKYTRPLNYAVWLSKNPEQKYPGNRKAVEEAGKKCEKLAKSKKRKVSVWFVQGQPAWEYGNRYGYCSLHK